MRSAPGTRAWPPMCTGKINCISTTLSGENTYLIHTTSGYSLCLSPAGFTQQNIPEYHESPSSASKPPHQPTFELLEPGEFCRSRSKVENGTYFKNTLPETNKFEPENGCLGEDPFLLGPGLFFRCNSKFCIFLSQKVYRFDFVTF